MSLFGKQGVSSPDNRSLRLRQLGRVRQTYQYQSQHVQGKSPGSISCSSFIVNAILPWRCLIRRGCTCGIYRISDDQWRNILQGVINKTFMQRSVDSSERKTLNCSALSPFSNEGSWSAKQTGSQNLEISFRLVRNQICPLSVSFVSHCQRRYTAYNPGGDSLSRSWEKLKVLVEEWFRRCLEVYCCSMITFFLVSSLIEWFISELYAEEIRARYP